MTYPPTSPPSRPLLLNSSVPRSTYLMVSLASWVVAILAPLMECTIVQCSIFKGIRQRTLYFLWGSNTNKSLYL